MWSYVVPVLYLCLCSNLGLTVASETRQRRQTATNDVITSARSKTGSITSPQFPNSYTSRENKLYTFSGRPEELVRIVFRDFDFYGPNPNEKCDERNSFLSYKRESGNTVYICRANYKLPIMSERPDFVLEYTVPRNLDARVQFKGFNASYEFITNFGIKSGKQVEPDECHFEYDGALAKSGSFNSPNFPGLYPSGFDCTYVFRGNEKDLKYLKFHFAEFNLLGEPSNNCSSATIDKLELTETTKNYHGYFDERRCGQLKSFDLKVNGSSFTIVFVSWDHSFDDSIFNESYPFFGFKADYEFTDSHAFSNLRSPGSSLQILLAVLCFVTSSFLGLGFI